MNDYRLIDQLILGDATISLLDVAANLGNINKAIIPREQLADIAQYRFARDRNKRLLTRSFLYEWLHSKYGLNCFRLGFNEFQQPYLETAPHIHFSFSYAKDYVLIGVREYYKIGVDIEYIDPALDIREMSPSIMCPEELSRFQDDQDNPAAQSTFFFSLFAAKESIIKSFGTGLYYEVKDINTICNNMHTYQSGNFTQHPLHLPIPGYASSVTLEQYL